MNWAHPFASETHPCLAPAETPPASIRDAAPRQAAAQSKSPARACQHLYRIENCGTRRRDRTVSDDRCGARHAGKPQRPSCAMGARPTILLCNPGLNVPLTHPHHFIAYARATRFESEQGLTADGRHRNFPQRRSRRGVRSDVVGIGLKPGSHLSMITVQGCIQRATGCGQFTLFLPVERHGRCGRASSCVSENCCTEIGGKG